MDTVQTLAIVLGKLGDTYIKLFRYLFNFFHVSFRILPYTPTSEINLIFISVSWTMLNTTE